jgi:hypothetical protein
MQCINHDDIDSECSGAVRERTSRSGCTVASVCDGHQAAHDKRLDDLEAALNTRYLGWNIPAHPRRPASTRSTRASGGTSTTRCRPRRASGGGPPPQVPRVPGQPQARV